MATAALTAVSDNFNNGKRTTRKSWTLTAANTAGAAWNIGEYRSFEIQVKGTWGGATPLVIKGSHDGTNYLNVRDLSTMADISLSADPSNLIVPLETPTYIYPSLTGGNGTTSIVVTIIARS